MENIVGIRFREVGKITYFKYSGDDLNEFDWVIAATRRGVEAGRVVISGYFKNIIETFSEDDKVIRKATPEDINVIEDNREKEKGYSLICREKIAEHRLKMKLVDVEYMFDRSKIVFYFVADGRVDFRNLVRDLAYTLKSRIELRQIGVRDEAKALGGLGICGKPLCCATFLTEFQSVSVKMAKDQGMSLNPAKISGVCGRLMCCLKYEEDTYLDIIEGMPKLGAIVDTGGRTGEVVGYNAIAGKVKVLLNGSECGVPVTFPISDVKIIKDAEIIPEEV